MFSLLENSFAGQEIVFTPYQLLQASETEGRVDSLLIDIQTHTTLPVGTSCDHLGWKKIAEPYLALLDAVSEDGSAFPTALAAIENMGENETREATLIWEGLRRSTQRCLDHFPIMICQKARNLGEKDTCVCGNNKAPFNYSMESDGACAGTLGSVCTSMHGPVHCVEDPDVDVACIPYKTSHPQHTGTCTCTYYYSYQFRACNIYAYNYRFQSFQSSPRRSRSLTSRFVGSSGYSTPRGMLPGGKEVLRSGRAKFQFSR
jgi:hypothetical protein